MNETTPDYPDQVYPWDYEDYWIDEEADDYRFEAEDLYDYAQAEEDAYAEAYALDPDNPEYVF